MIKRVALIAASTGLLLLVGCSRFPTIVELEPQVKLGPLNTVEVAIRTNLPTPSRFFVSVCSGPDFCSELCETAIVEISRSSQSYVSSLGYHTNYKVFVAWLKSANQKNENWFDKKLKDAKLKEPALIQRAPDGSYQVVAETYFRVGTEDEEFKHFSNRLKLIEARLDDLKKAAELLQSSKPDSKRLLALTDELSPVEIADPFYPQMWALTSELAEKASCARDTLLARTLGVEIPKSKQNCLDQSVKSLDKATTELERIKSCSGFLAHNKGAQR